MLMYVGERTFGESDTLSWTNHGTMCMAEVIEMNVYVLIIIIITSLYVYVSK